MGNDVDKIKIARLISIVLGPHVWLPAVLLAIIFKTGLSNGQIAILFPTLLLFQIIIPLGYLSVAAKIGRVSAWDLPKREERKEFLIIWLAVSFITLLLIYFLGNQFLLTISLVTFCVTVIFALITKFWKISLHMAIAAYSIVVINLLLDWKMLPLFLAIPLIAWARFKLGRHTLAQILVGLILSLSLTFFALFWTGLW